MYSCVPLQQEPEPNNEGSEQSDSRSNNKNLHLIETKMLSNRMTELETTLLNTEKEVVDLKIKYYYAAETERKLRSTEMKIFDLMKEEFNCSLCRKIVLIAAKISWGDRYCLKCATEWMQVTTECAKCWNTIQSVTKFRNVENYHKKVQENYAMMGILVPEDLKCNKMELQGLPPHKKLK